MRKLTKKILSAVLSACMITTLFAGTALAANDRERVLNIGLSFSNTIEAGQSGTTGTVTVTPLAEGYTVTSATLINQPETWQLDSIPQAEIVITCDENHYFPLYNRSVFDLKNGARYVSASLSEDKSTATLKVTLDPVGDGRDLDVATANWSADGSFTGSWAPAADAVKYQVRLFRGSITIEQVGSVAEVTDATEFDFTSMIKQKGDYHFEVRAVNYYNTKGEWTSSEMLYVTQEFEDAQKAANTKEEVKLEGPGVNGVSEWVQDDNGWWFRNFDGSYTTNGWQQIKEDWYFFDENGYMKTGWIDWDGRQFFCDPTTGAMLHDTTTPDGATVGADGGRI